MAVMLRRVVTCFVISSTKKKRSNVVVIMYSHSHLLMKESDALRRIGIVAVGVVAVATERSVTASCCDVLVGRFLPSSTTLVCKLMVWTVTILLLFLM